MSQITKCPGCETAIRLDGVQAYAQVMCPNCQLKFDISQDDGTNPSPVIQVKSKRKVRRRKKSHWPMVVGLFSMAAIVLALGAYVYHERQRKFELVAIQEQKELLAEKAARDLANSQREVTRAPEPTEEIPLAEPEGLSFEMPEMKPDPEPKSKPVPVNPTASLLESLARLGKQCEVFQFLPENQSQYKTLQTFALKLSQAKTMLADDQANKQTEKQAGELDSTSRLSLTEQLAHWQQTWNAMTKQVAAETPERLSGINAFAKHEFENGKSGRLANSQIIFYGFVFIGGITQPNSILKFDRKQVYFEVPNNPELTEMGDASYRLIRVESAEAASQTLMNSPGGGLIQVHAAKLIEMFDPIGPGESL